MGSPIDLELGRGSKPVLNSILPSTPSKIPDLVRIRSINPREITLQINIAPIQHRTRFAKVRALLDSGASTIYIDRTFALKVKLPLLPMATPIPVYNVDGTRNSAGDISHYAEIVIEHQGHREKVTAEITDLGKNQMILGYTWLKHHNPEIDWITGNVRMTRCPPSCRSLKGRTPFVRQIESEENDSMAHIYAIKQKDPEPSPPKPDPKPEDLVPKEYHKYLKTFSKKESERMPVRKPWDHAIDLKEDTFKPKKGRLIPLSPKEQEEVSEFVEDQLKKGYIRPSKSPQTSPVFFVPKKDGRKRMVQDYRYLNEHTVKNNYPLPLISQLVDKLKGAKWFTKIDLRWGYNNVRIKEGDEWKAAFVCHKGSFEPTVMYFGLCNSPATFQTMMNEIFSDMDDVMVIYIDDLMIYTKTDNLEEHDKLVLEVLRRLEENDLFAKPEKCTFRVQEVEFLGMIVSRNGIQMDNSKVQAIKEWPTPKNVKGVRSFLGLANFYRRFIKDYAQIARPLNDLTKKDTPFEWSERQQKAFDNLKDQFTTAPVLAYPDTDKHFRLETDASDFATGAVLSIELDGKWHPVAFSSHSMSPEERNYPIADKEMLSVIRSLEQWRHYLEGAQFEFEIWNDHANLQWFMKRQDLNRRQARWAQYLSRFHYKWVHKAGAQMGKADALSRREDHTEGMEDDNKGVLVIPTHHIQNTVQITTDAEEILKRIKGATKMLNELGITRLCNEQNMIKEDELLFDQNRKIYVPDDHDLRMEITRLHHDTPIAGHAGAEKTLELIQRSYSWPGMTTFVRDYVSRCDRCARFKGTNYAPAGKLHPLDLPDVPWEEVTTDFTTDLPLSNGFDSILVVVDRFSKEVEFIPCNKTATAMDTARLYLHNVWKNHGLPRSIVSDRGPQYASQVMQDLCKRLGIQSKMSTAYHPQTDGQTERMNRDLQQYLRLFTAEKQEQWADWLPLAQFSYNSKKQTSTKKSPFEITRSYQPRMGFEQRMAKAPAAESFTTAMKDTLAQTKENLEKAQKHMKTQADRHRSAAPEYVIGDKVWLSTDNLRLTRASRKLTEKWLGPYEITKLIGDNAVELRLPKSMRIHPVVNISRVRPYKERLKGQSTFRPGPVQVTEDRELEYEVDHIVDSRLKGNRLEYLVHWKGYSDEDRTWEPLGHLSSAQGTIKDFHKVNPSAPRKIRMIQSDFLSLFTDYGKSCVETPLAKLPFDRLEVDL
jgi:transposase InsO family protein